MAARVLVTANMPRSWLEPLDRFGHAVVLPEPGVLDHRALVAMAPRVDAIISLLTDRIDAEVLEAGASGTLRVIGNIAVGVDNIDVSRASELDIAVCNTPGVLDAATAEVTMLLMLAASRRAFEAERALRAGDWSGWGLTDFLGTDLEAATLALVGHGRIARAVELRAQGFGMRVLHHARRDTGERGYVADLDQMLTEADVVSIHVPLSPATANLIDASRLAAIPRGGVLVNTARGGIVDEDALADALERGALGAAGLDVYLGEPNVAPRLLAAPNLVMLPHIGSATSGTRSRMAMLACEGVCAVLEGRSPPNIVLAESSSRAS